jgi:hypothetical protein
VLCRGAGGITRSSGFGSIVTVPSGNQTREVSGLCLDRSAKSLYLRS